MGKLIISGNPYAIDKIVVKQYLSGDIELYDEE